MPVVPLQKSTIVRAKFAGLRLAFPMLERLAPPVAAAWADRIWFTLPQRAHTQDPVDPDAEVVTVASQGTDLRAVRWGSGPVVYLVHGWGGHLGQMRPYVAPLVAAGHTVVAFDGPSHGASSPGPSGPRSSNAVEVGRALDDVGARFGQPAAIVAHSMGAMSTVLALRDGWLSTPRLAFIAPMRDLSTYFDQFQQAVGFGRRTRRRLDARVERRVGYRVEGFELLAVAADIERPDLLVVHDETDRNTMYAGSVAVVDGWPGAELVTTRGLGHRRILSDPAVVRRVVDFVSGQVADESDMEADLTA